VAAAALGYIALRALGELHIRDCVEVAQSVRHLVPPPVSSGQTAHVSTGAPHRRAFGWSRLRLR